MALMNLYNIDVEISQFAMEKILMSGQEGVRYPQAIAEIFSAHFKDVFAAKKVSAKINIDCESKKKVFPLGAGETELIIATRFELIDVNGSAVQGAPEPYWIYTNYADLCQVRYTNRSNGFNAAFTAKEHARMFGEYYKDYLL